MRTLLKLFLALYNKNCSSITFAFTDGTSETISSKHACNAIIKAAKDDLAAKLTNIVEPKQKEAKK